MDVDLQGIVKRIKPLWQTLTDGGLIVLTDGGVSPGSIRGKKLPVAVQRAVRENASLEPLETRKAFWWVISPSPQLRGHVQLVAWAREDKGWKDLLQSWTDMLTIASSETAVADRLTEALVEAWGRLCSTQR